MLKQTLALLLLLPLAFPASIEVEILGSPCPEGADFLHVLYNLPTCIVEKFFSTLISGFVYSATQFLDNALGFIIIGPDITLFCSPYAKIMRIIESLYTLALMGVGAYFIISAADIEKRVRAKIWLENILFMIIAVSFSFAIFQMILEINQYITNSIYDHAFASLFDIHTSFSSLAFALVVSSNFIMWAGLTFMTLLIRYIMLPFLLLAFPFAIFLYFIPFTRDWGAFMLKFILIIIFMTSVDAVLIAGVSYLFSVGDPLLSGGFVEAMALMLGFGLIGIVNTIIYIVAILSLVTAAARMFDGIISIGWKIALLAKFL